MSTNDACIVCTINRNEDETGKYCINIDVVQKKKANEQLKKRTREGFAAKTSGFFGGGKSPLFEVEDDSVVTFEIEAALRPMSALKQGEGRIECKNIKKNFSSRQIHLEPNDNSFEKHGVITFYHNGEYLHKVTIADIHKGDKDKGHASIRANRLSDSGAAATLGLGAEPYPESFPGHVFEESGFPASVSGDDDNSTITDFVTATQSTRHTQSTGSRSIISRSTDISGSSSIDAISQLPRVFNDKSLHALSGALGPHDARRLLVHLNVDDALIKTELRNHPNDCGLAYADLFIKWQKKVMNRGDAYMRQEMETNLAKIDRNDIKMKFMKFACENTELTPEDFK